MTDATERDRLFVEQHTHRMHYVQTRIDSGLNAEEIVAGVRVSHEEYVRLVKLAQIAVALAPVYK